MTATDSTPALTYARFRISASPGALSTGYADYGEVEDYVVNVSKTRLTGHIWYDKNSNGLQDDGVESKISGVKVELFDPTSNSVVAVTQTDESGSYLFNEKNYPTRSGSINAAQAYVIRVATLHNTSPFSNWSITTAEVAQMTASIRMLRSLVVIGSLM